MSYAQQYYRIEARARKKKRYLARLGRDPLCCVRVRKHSNRTVGGVRRRRTLTDSRRAGLAGLGGELRAWKERTGKRARSVVIALH